MAFSRKKTEWLILSVVGILLFSFGLCLLAEASIAKFRGQPWFWPGTLALIIVNTGLCTMFRASETKVQAQATDSF